MLLFMCCFVTGDALQFVHTASMRVRRCTDRELEQSTESKMWKQQNKDNKEEFKCQMLSSNIFWNEHVE
jgi:hypothetical protein